MLTAKQVIELLQLEPLPVEGGYYRQTYLAADSVSQTALGARYSGSKPFSSAIYYLLQSNDFSALHKLSTDEVYHFYLGDPVEMLLLYPDGASNVVMLGQNIEAGQSVQVVVPHGVWQGSHLLKGGQWALMGTTMAPAFDSSDFQLGEREALSRKYPERVVLIRALTRVELA